MPEKIALYMDQFVGSGSRRKSGVICQLICKQQAASSKQQAAVAGHLLMTAEKGSARADEHLQFDQAWLR
ncbi:MAG: hypothetical protein J0G33_01230 [Afipia felis]|nr:hypothetical protein [Afipia felis]